MAGYRPQPADHWPVLRAGAWIDGVVGPYRSRDSRALWSIVAGAGYERGWTQRVAGDVVAEHVVGQFGVGVQQRPSRVLGLRAGLLGGVGWGRVRGFPAGGDAAYSAATGLVAELTAAGGPELRLHSLRIALDVEAGGHPRAQVDSRLRIRGKVERSRCGRVTRIVGAVSDVSDLRRREASAEQSRQLLTRVVDALPFAVTVRTSDQGYQVCNRAAMALPGVLALARPGRARSGADELAQAIASGESCVIAGGAGGSREVSLVDADERRRCWSIEQLPIEATHGVVSRAQHPQLSR